MSLSELHQFYMDWPFEVSLETTALCNAACTFCPYPTLERQGEKLPDTVIDRIIEELSRHPLPFYFSPFKVNEPLLDKRTIPLCKRVNREVPNAHIRFFSNGSALTEKNIRGLSEIRQVEHLWISLNSHNAEEYEATMSLPFERTVKNLDRLHELVDGGEFTHPVVVSKVRDYESDGAFMDYVTRRWPLFRGQWIKRDGWLGYVEPGSPEIPDTPCVRWFELSITATGIVSLCCMDGRAQFPIGDVTRQSLQEIYNAPAYRERREKLLSRRLIEPCSTCTY